MSVCLYVVYALENADICTGVVGIGRLELELQSLVNYIQCGFWESNPWPLQAKFVFLTPESSL